MKNKSFITILAIGAIALCGCPKKHVHDVSEGFEHDATNHWHVCADCDEKLDLAEHDFEETILTKASCTAEGSKKLKCKVCEYETIVPISKTSHTFSKEWTTNATHHWHSCKDCTEKADYSEHDWNEGTVITPATYETTGSAKYVCKTCSKSEIRVIPMKEHTYKTEFEHDEKEHWHLCADEGFETLESEHEAHSCTWEKDNMVYHKGTCECGLEMSGIHDFVLNKDGVTATCSGCGFTVPYLTINVEFEPLIAGQIGSKLKSVTSNIPLEEFGVYNNWATIITEKNTYATVETSSFHKVVPVSEAGTKVTNYCFYLGYEKETQAIHNSTLTGNQTLNINVVINGYSTIQNNGMSTSNGFGYLYSTAKYSPSQKITDVVLDHPANPVTTIKLTTNIITGVDPDDKNYEFAITKIAPKIAFGKENEIELIPENDQEDVWLSCYLTWSGCNYTWGGDTVAFTLDYYLGGSYYPLFEFLNGEMMEGFGTYEMAQDMEVPTMYMSLIKNETNINNGYVDSSGLWAFTGSELTLRPSYYYAQAK